MRLAVLTSRNAVLRLLICVLATALVLGSAEIATAAPMPTVPSAVPTETALAPATRYFDAGELISDAVFTDTSTMSETDVQAFFDSKVTSCRVGSDAWGPYVCLKDFTISSFDRPADAYCDGYQGAESETAARIVSRVANSCGINPQVLIVMLQKEQGLVTHTWPSAWRYDIALGQGCPDTGECDPEYVGFFQQIYGAARQMQMYLEGKYFTWYAPGKTWDIPYHPNIELCGKAPVHIRNKATSALYYYTPYQPNAGALAVGYEASSDPCASYGNRNFYNYFTDWFGDTLTGFADVAGNTASSNYTSFAAEITWMREQSISTGYSIGWGKKEYRPFGTVTRDAMAAFLYRAAGSPAFTPPSTSPFTDVTTESPFYKEITWLADTGITTGWGLPSGAREYRPFANITRDAMAVFLYRYAGSPTFTQPSTSPFADVPPGNGFYKEITWLADLGITTGWEIAGGKKEFRPYNAITRDAMAAFLYRFDGR